MIGAKSGAKADILLSDGDEISYGEQVWYKGAYFTSWFFENIKLFYYYYYYYYYYYIRDMLVIIVAIILYGFLD